MKIILSRKGFDSSAGGHASPILPDGSMLSLPIPSRLDDLAYGDIALRRASGRRALRPRDRRHGTTSDASNDAPDYAALIRELDAGARLAGGAHLDPDLVAGARPRARGWRPAFGQIGSAGGHLRRAGIGAGDVFLFFGWFRHAQPTAARATATRLRFVPGDSGFHALFGYLEVGSVIDATGRAPLPNWLRDHPHAHPRRRATANNTIYVATRTLSADPSLPGAGAFRFDASLVLTQPGESRSRWRLDRDVFGGVAISHHDADAWRGGIFQSCRRGQEFVIDANARVREWVLATIRSGMK